MRDERPAADLIAAIPSARWETVAVRSDASTTERWAPLIVSNVGRSWLGPTRSGEWFVGVPGGHGEHLRHGRGLFICSLVTRPRAEVRREVADIAGGHRLDVDRVWGSLPLTLAIEGALGRRRSYWIDPALNWIEDVDLADLETDLRACAHQLDLDVETRRRLCELLLTGRDRGHHPVSTRLSALDVHQQHARDALVAIVREVRDWLDRNEVDVDWTLYRTTEVLDDVEDHAARLEAGDFTRLAELVIRFGELGAFHEIAHAGGWEDHFLLLAGRFDDLVPSLWPLASSQPLARGPAAGSASGPRGRWNVVTPEDEIDRGDT